MASHYIGPTTSGASAESGKHTDKLYASVSSWVTSSEFQDEYAACGRRFTPRRKYVWVRPRLPRTRDPGALKMRTEEMEVWVGPGAGAGGLIQSNTFIK